MTEDWSFPVILTTNVPWTGKPAASTDPPLPPESSVEKWELALILNPPFRHIGRISYLNEILLHPDRIPEKVIAKAELLTAFSELALRPKLWCVTKKRGKINIFVGPEQSRTRPHLGT